MTLEEALPFLLPIIALQLLLMITGLHDLTRPERRVKGGSKMLWGVVIVLGQLLGPLIYFLVGREES